MKEYALRFLMKIFGDPLCGGCVAYQINCIGRCGLSKEQRIQHYLKKTGNSDPKLTTMGTPPCGSTQGDE